ncbi:MAG: hypothetical protein K5787_07475 [Lentisphaeria bacterium]|nr:hypothetical protein [Lentisphaeria bacterium]
MKNKRSIGLDIGSASVKVSVFEGDGRNARFVEAREFDLTEEGILNEGEMYHGLHDWLAGQKLLGAKTCLGIPQYIATTQLADFPPSKPSQLAALVEQETKQMGDFTDEHFLHGYVSVKGGFGRKNPVLIGLCREQAIREKMDALSRADIPCDDVAMSGMAVVNTLYHLHPEYLDEKRPILILDLGKVNSTAIVVTGGQPLFMGSMMFSGDSFEQAVRERVSSHKSLAGMGEHGVATMLAEVDLTAESSHSDLWRAAKSLDSEIQNVVEHWRSQECAELAEVPINKVYLCGGASRVGGLRAWLENAFESKMELLGPEFGGTVHPEYAVAFGLGLESAHGSSLPLSLLPPDVVAMQHRKKRFPYAVGAAAAIVLSILGIELLAWHASSGMMQQMSHYEEQLRDCEALIRKIDENMAAIGNLEQRMAPVAETVNRSGRILKTLDLLSRSTEDGTWFYYLADVASYRGWGGREEHAEEIQEAARRGRRLPKEQKKAVGGLFDGGVAEKENRTDMEFPVVVRVGSVKDEAAMIAAGFTTMEDKAGYSEAMKRVGELAVKLSDKKVFGRVDTTEDISEGARAELAAPWTDFLLKMKGHHYKPFTLRMPYAEPELRRE